MLERDGGDGWARQYSFTLDPVWPADLEMANHFTATRPGTRFTTLTIASAATPDGYVSLIDRGLTTSRMGRSDASEIADAEEYRRVLAEAFGLTLSPDEVEMLGLF
jgi:N-hydroxyarylamine O-acetyltransferase